jgi:hypothetical protein
MNREALGTYLNDHLAGSVMAVEMIEATLNHGHDTPLADFLKGLIVEIREDQEVLRSLLEGLKVKENPIKKAGAWVAEKVGRLKTSGSREGAMGRFEMLEALSLGIVGKLKLWIVLERVGPKYPELAAFDYSALQGRARSQHDRVEAHRVDAALAVF